MEDEAIKKFFGLMIGAPFDDLELDDLIKEMFDEKGDFNKSCLSKNFYSIFEDWIKNEHCERSRSLVIEKLKNLSYVLDKGSEDTSHPKSYETEIKKTASSTPTPIVDFWIIGLSKKSVKPGEELIVFGNGFDNQQYVTFNFHLGNLPSSLPILTKTKRYIKLQIPKNTDGGIYDVYADFQIKLWYAKSDQTIGIPLKIIVSRAPASIFKINFNN